MAPSVAAAVPKDKLIFSRGKSVSSNDTTRQHVEEGLVEESVIPTIAGVDIESDELTDTLKVGLTASAMFSINT